MTSTALAVLASIIFLIRLLPQPVRLTRTGEVAGVSPLAAMNALVGDAAWLVYGLTADLPAVWLVSVVAMIPAMWTVILLRQECRSSDAAGSLAWVALLVVAALLRALAGALAVGVVVNQGPQVWKAMRDRDLSGISAATWWVSIADALAWGAYGLVVGDMALKLYCVVLLTSALVVLSRLHWVRLMSEPAVAAAVTDPRQGPALGKTT